MSKNSFPWLTQRTFPPEGSKQAVVLCQCAQKPWTFLNIFCEGKKTRKKNAHILIQIMRQILSRFKSYDSCVCAFVHRPHCFHFYSTNSNKNADRCSSYDHLPDFATRCNLKHGLDFSRQLMKQPLSHSYRGRSKFKILQFVF